MKRPLFWCLFLAACASSRAPDVRRELDRFHEEEEALYARGCTPEEDFAHRRLWIARSRDLTRCGDPAQEQDAYAAWGLLVSNLRMAGDPEPARDALPVFREWARRYPGSTVLGENVWMLLNACGPDGDLEGVHAFLRELSRSDVDDVARPVLWTLASSDLEDDPTPLLEEIVRRWPDTWEAGVAQTMLRGLALRPGVPAPPLALETIDGGPLTLDALRGRIVLLAFFDFG